MADMGYKKVDVKAFFDKDLAKEVVEKAAMKGLRKLGEVILTDAQKRCPVDTGTLQRSGTVQKTRDKNEVIISFNTPYALYQHEGVNFRHPKGGEAKYLERAFNEHINQAQYYAEKEIADATYKEKAKKWGY